MARRGASTVALLCVCGALVDGQLHISHAPPELLSRLEGLGLPGVQPSGAGILLTGRTAAVGSPFYGDRRVGQLILTDFIAGVCSPATAASDSGSVSSKQHWVAAIRAQDASRSCHSVAQVVRTLQGTRPRGASAVLFLDDGIALNRAFPELEPFNDSAADVVIPTLWLPDTVGGPIYDSLLTTALPSTWGELRWGLSHPLDVVPVDLWTNLADPAANWIAWELASAMRHFRHLTRLTGRWALELTNSSLPVDAGGGRCVTASGLGIGDAGLSCCFPEPLPTMPATPLGPVFEGPAKFREVARQKCLRQLAAPDVQWEYLDRMYTTCGATASDDAELERCSLSQVSALVSDAGAIARCSEDEYGQLIQEEVRTPSPSRGNAPVVLRIAGWVYSGPLDPGRVMEAICDHLAAGGQGPPLCGGAWHWREPRWFVTPVPVWPAGIAAVVAACVAPCVLPLLALALRRRAGRYFSGYAPVDNSALVPSSSMPSGPENSTTTMLTAPPLRSRRGCETELPCSSGAGAASYA